MKPISELVKYYGNKARTAQALGKCHSTVDRWCDKGALIDDNGAVWIKTGQTEWRGEKK